MATFAALAAPASLPTVPSSTVNKALVRAALTNPIPSGASGLALYRMRAYDSTLSQIVYWNANDLDATGASYGGPGPLVDVVLFMFLGA